MATGSIFSWLKEAYFHFHHQWPSWIETASSDSNTTDLAIYQRLLATKTTFSWLKEAFFDQYLYEWPSWSYKASAPSNVTDVGDEKIVRYIRASSRDELKSKLTKATRIAETLSGKELEFVALFTDKRTDVYLLESLRSLPPLGSAAHLGLATGFLLALAINARLDVYKGRQWAELLVARVMTGLVSLLLAALFLPAAGVCLLIFSTYRQLSRMILRATKGSRFAGLLEGSDAVWAVENSSALSVISVLALVKQSESEGSQLLSRLRELAQKELLAPSVPEKLRLLRRWSPLGYYYWERPQNAYVQERVRWLTDCPAPLTPQELRALVSAHCNSALPENHAAGWEILVGQGPLRKARGDVVLSVEDCPSDTGHALFPVLFRVHHSVGDGVSLLHLLLRSLSGTAKGRASPIIAKVPTLEAMPATTAQPLPPRPRSPRSPTPESRPSTPYYYSIDVSGSVSYNPCMPQKLKFLPVTAKLGSPDSSRSASPLSHSRSPVPPFLTGHNREPLKILNGQKPFRPHSPLGKSLKLHCYNDNYISFPDEYNNCNKVEGQNTTIYYYNTSDGGSLSGNVFDGDRSPLRSRSPCYESGEPRDTPVQEDAIKSANIYEKSVDSTICKNIDTKATAGISTPKENSPERIQDTPEHRVAPRPRPRLSIGNRPCTDTHAVAPNRYVSLLRKIGGHGPGWATSTLTLMFAPTSLLHQALLRAADVNPLHDASTLSGEKVASWTSEEGLLAAVRRIRSRVKGTHFTDVIFSALSAALEKRLGAAAPRSVTAVLPCRMDAWLPGDMDLQNRFSVGLLTLPVATPASEVGGKWSARARLRETSRHMEVLRRAPDCQINYWLMRTVAGLLPSALLRPLIRSTQSTLALSNMRGPAAPIQLSGGDVSDLVFWVPHRDSTGVGVSVLSYAGELYLGLVIDRGLVPDPEDTERLLADLVAEIRALDAETELSVAH